MAVGRTIIIQPMDNTTAAAGFQTHLLRAVAFMDGKCKTVYTTNFQFGEFEIQNQFRFDHSLGPEQPQNPDLQTQPAMLTLKQFLATQDDSISDSDAIEKYNEYKSEFKRQQLNEFFVAHKDEEW